jgi:predicted Zn-dependent peptidase
MVLAVSGGLPKNTLRRIIKKYFNNVKPTGSWQPNGILNRKRDTKVVEDQQVPKDFNHVNIHSSIYLDDTPKPFSLEEHALQIASEVLSTRVFLDIREKQGLAYFITSNLNNIDHGYLFELYGEFPTEKYVQAKEQMLKYVTDILANPITEEEYKRALRKLKSVRWADSARAIAPFVSRNLLYYGQLWLPEVRHQFYDQLTLEKVNQIADGALSGKKIESITVGKF